MKNILFLLGLSILLMSACEKQVDTEADIEKIKNMDKMWDQAVLSGDVDKIMSFYTDDAMRMPPNRPLIKGIKAIRDDHQSFHEKNNMTESKNISEEVIICGDWVIARGTSTETYVPKSGGEPEQDTSKWIITYKRQSDGQFKIHHEMFNSDLPVKE